ncbi:MAG: class I mannose-6-phosphate isomerase [Saprospiraceae bacterium]|nr:class I mannose-6-phosphate isomerase [Saprospiraceae bacterium]
MDTLYPLKFKSIFKDKIWGGQKIKEVFGKDFSPLANCGEAWVVSGVQGFESVVENGFLAGNELNELIEVYMGDLVGDKVYDEHGEEFPVLIKFIDANDYLSIQVHPDDKLAQKRGFKNGKSEMWYIIDAEKDSELISGFSKKVEPQDYIDHLQNKTLKSILNVEKVKKDEVYYMPAGRVHALGPGVLLAEIQQTSDTTYRIYDWDRLGVDGIPRELHIAEALDAIDFNVYKNYKTDYKNEINKTSEVLKTIHFTTNILEFDSLIQKDYSEVDSFVIYVCIEGKVAVNSKEAVEFQAGEAILIPNIVNIVELFPESKSKILEVYI